MCGEIDHPGMEDGGTRGDGCMVGAGVVRGWRAGQALAWFVVDPVNCVEHFCRRYGPVVRVQWRQTRPVLVLIGPAFNRDVLMATDRLRPTGIWPVRAPEGSAQANLRRNLLTVHGAEHKPVSNSLLPHLERGQVELYFDQVRRIALAEIGSWPVGERVDVYALFRDLAQRYAFEVLFGIADPERSREFGARIADYHAANWKRTAAIVRLDLPGTPYRKVLRRAEALQSFVLDLMAQARGCPMHRDVRCTMASLQDAAGEPLSAARAAALMSSIALASYETTATTLTWALVLLSQHPDVMTALANEITDAGPTEDLNSARLGELKLLDAVLKETLRILTPVPMLGFKTLRDCEIAGFDLPEAATVMISPHLTHRLPELYEQPDRFLPERWFAIRPTTYEYLPFSGGPRRCPGYLFAMANMRMTLAVLLARCNVGLIDGARYNRSYAAVNVPHGAVPALLSQRRGAPVVAKVPRRLGSVFELFAPAVAA